MYQKYWKSPVFDSQCNCSVQPGAVLVLAHGYERMLLLCFVLKDFLLLCKAVPLCSWPVTPGDTESFSHVIPLSCSLPAGAALSPLAFWSSPVSVMDMRQNGCFSSEIIASILFIIELIKPIVILGFLFMFLLSGKRAKAFSGSFCNFFTFK